MILSKTLGNNGILECVLPYHVPLPVHNFLSLPLNECSTKTTRRNFQAKVKLPSAMNTIRKSVAECVQINMIGLDPTLKPVKPWC